MATIINSQRLGTLLSVATGLLLVSGCRSASVNSNSDPNSAYVPSGPQPFFRSFDRAPRPYDEESLSPQPEPPDILPVPGYSDPAVPPVPPAPSTQKQRRTLFPAAVKYQPANPSNAKVNQTGGKASGRAASANLGSAQSIPMAPPSQSNELNDEPVPLKMSAPGSGPQLSRPVRVDDRLTEHSSASDSVVAGIDSNQNPAITSSKQHFRNRYGKITPWPYAQDSVLKSDASTRGAGNSNASLGQPQSLSDSSSSSGEMPHLLPPNP